MGGYLGLPGHDISPDKKLVPVYTYFVRVCGFTFQFGSVAQIDAALDYFKKKLHPSSRMPNYEWLKFERYWVQRWYERLPGYLRQESKRQKVVKALEEAAEMFAEYRGKFPTQKSNTSNLP